MDTNSTPNRGSKEDFLAETRVTKMEVQVCTEEQDEATTTLPVTVKTATSGLEWMTSSDPHAMAGKKLLLVEVAVMLVLQVRIRRVKEAKAARATLSPFLELGFTLLGLNRSGPMVGLQIYAMMPGQA